MPLQTDSLALSLRGWIPAALLSHDGLICEVNGSLCQLLDQPDATLIGSAVDEWVNPVDGETVLQILQDRAAMEMPFQGEVSLRSNLQNGHPAVAGITALPSTNSGRPTFLLQIVSQDIATDRTAIAAAPHSGSRKVPTASAIVPRDPEMVLLREVVDTLPIGLALFDPDDCLVFANDAYLQGLEFLPGTSYEDLLRSAIAAGHYAEFEDGEEHWVRTRLAEHCQLSSKAMLQLRDQRWRQLRERRTRDGYFISLCTDSIAPLSDSPTTLPEAHAMQNSVPGQSQFLTNMSHELRTPLNAILGFSEIISLEALGRVEPREYRTYGQDIYESGLLLLNLVNNLLDRSRIENGQFTLHEQTLSLEEILASVKRTWAPVAHKRNLTLSVYMDIEFQHLRADERAVRQMLLSLCANAVKFTPNGGQVELRAWQKNGAISIEVIDTGIGVMQEYLPILTSQFTHIDNAMLASDQSTGLSLSVIKSLIELHGGKFGFDSKPDKGTRAGLYFPSWRSISATA